jgi:uncharacterized membrane protein
MRNKQPQSNRITFRKWKPSFVGILFGVLMFCVSLLPSLLPRPWLMQGVVSGLSIAIGYSIGLAVSALFRWLVQKEPSPQIKHKSWQVLRFAAPAVIILFFILGINWQNEVRELVGSEKITGPFGVLILISSFVVARISISIGRYIRRMGRFFNRKISQKVPARVGIVSALGLSIFIVYFIVSGLFFSTFLRVADGIYGARDNRAPDGVVQPMSSERSGSPESLIPWEKIGFQGRGFVGTGPSPEKISEFSGSPALQPVRVYAGLASAASAEERAELALAELKRTNAFDREVLVIATATGTGWLDPYVVDTLEIMYGGDTAIVSQQYSYLPSWISFLVDQERAREAGRVLYDTIIDEWSVLPEETRPKLLVYGLSLGSFGGQAAFSGTNDIRRSVDGALFAGSPNVSEVWRNTTDNRDEGSPEWQPVFRNGESVRFASTREDIIADPSGWKQSRVLFLQHANDPVVWFDFSLIFNKPDWLSEPRGRAVSSATRWYPIVTFLQIGLDQAVAASAPIGEGHYYIDTPAYAWAAVLPPDNWAVEDSDRLKLFVENDFQPLGD